MKRLFDLLLSFIAGIIFLPLIFLISVLILMSSPGPILYSSRRVGKDNKIFKMLKFRSMKINAPVLATHLLGNPDVWLTPIGAFLRKSSLDELPQLWNVLTGDMSLIGPRPALFNQDDLIRGRTDLGISKLAPGLTGWAQINGRDEISLEEKLRFDLEYLHRQSFFFDMYILLGTIKKVLKTEGISH
jgi:O-antigen biosynthesis protein WbqP